MTKVEWFVWSRLRSRQLAGYKFRRQVPIGPYFADFACLSVRLVIEIDGDTHELERDDRKTAWLDGAGYRVLRFAAGDAYESIDEVIHAIYLEVTSESESPHPGLRPDLPAVRGGE